MAVKKPKQTPAERHAEQYEEAQTRYEQEKAGTANHWQLNQLWSVGQLHAALSRHFASGEFFNLTEALSLEAGNYLWHDEPRRGVPGLLKKALDGLDEALLPFGRERWPAMLEQSRKARAIALAEDKAREERKKAYTTEEARKLASETEEASYLPFQDPASEARSKLFYRLWRLLQFAAHIQAKALHPEYRVPVAWEAADRAYQEIMGAVPTLAYEELEMADNAIDDYLGAKELFAVAIEDAV